ncbi:hypothetical protein [Chryseobacterium sp. FH1]|uniref:hypothetical protein n=1 Tax=Chryseobacterium sp. FH1 TaxID=1233951 RepID=UPI0004E314FE|nr:hypothetical protein [Chryseobacterium sp. FH1]KFC19364.1 hypothetical protein IO90_08655 [Chryseobacterium sp. FH1]
MEISGTILIVGPNYIRIRTVKKKQEIDVFFPDSKAKAMEALYEPNMGTTIEVEVQSFEFENVRYAKFWAVFVIRPRARRLDDCPHMAAINWKNLTDTLYKPEDRDSSDF